MGSYKRPRIPVAEIVERYLAGESAGMLSLRARVPHYRIPEILREAGVRVRGPNEALRVALDQRRLRCAG